MTEDKYMLPINNNESSNQREGGPAAAGRVTSRHVQVSLKEEKKNWLESLCDDDYYEVREIIKRSAQFVVAILLMGACYVHYALRSSSYKTNSSRPVPIPLPPPQYSIKSFRTSDVSSYVIKCPVGNRTVYCNVDPPGNTDVGGYMFYRNSLVPPYPPRKGKIWGFMIQESPYSAPEVMYDKFWRQFNVTSTYNRNSDVPITLFHLPNPENLTSTEFFVPTAQKNRNLLKLAPVMYLQSNCDTWTKRDEYVEELMKYIKVDSYGLCLNNKRLPNNLNFGDTIFFDSYDPKLLRLTGQYKFSLVIENAVCHDYVTEKLWRSLIAGAVPLYLGSPDVRDVLPDARAALLLSDFPTPELLARRLHQLLRNDSLYDLHLQHKTRRLITNPILLDMLRTQFRNYSADNSHWKERHTELLCLMCSLLHEPGPTPRMASRRHCNCHPPIRALTMTPDPTSTWIKNIDRAELNVKLLSNESSTLQLLPNILDSYVQNANRFSQ